MEEDEEDWLMGERFRISLVMDSMVGLPSSAFFEASFHSWSNLPEMAWESETMVDCTVSRREDKAWMAWTSGS